jgi:hypothetical protein
MLGAMKGSHPTPQFPDDMSNPIFDDKRTGQLLSRVREDISSLRHDMRSLLRHTTRHTVPDGARGLARSGRDQLLHGRDYAADRVRWVGRSAREHPAGVSMAGVVLLGAVALGAYLLLRGGCCQEAVEDEIDLGDEI